MVLIIVYKEKECFSKIKSLNYTIAIFRAFVDDLFHVWIGDKA